MSWVHVDEAKQAVAEDATGPGEEDKGKKDTEGLQDMDTEEGNVGTAPTTEDKKEGEDKGKEEKEDKGKETEDKGKQSGEPELTEEDKEKKKGEEADDKK